MVTWRARGAALPRTNSYGDSALTGGRLLARNTILSILGESAPLALGMVAIPILVRELGADRYGILTLSYIVVSYLGLFDLGLGRAAVQQISDAIGAEETDRIPQIFWTSVTAMMALGLGAAAIIIGISHWLVNTILHLPRALGAESVVVFIVLGAAMPFILSGSCLTGTLASLQRFDLTATIGAATGIYSFAAPLAVLAFTDKLPWIVFALVAGRVCAWSLSLMLCLRLVPDLAEGICLSGKSLGSLVRFGGWITVSGLASPLMVNLDRLIIGSMLSIAAVTYYSVPYQIVNKLPLLPGAMSSVLFPAFSATARRDPARASSLFERTSRYSLLVLFPGVLVLFCFAPELLSMFFGSNVSGHSSSAMRWLLIGVLMNGLAFIPYGLVQAANRPDLTAKFHLAECPVYFAALFLLLLRFGISGAAAAWTLRVTIDALALFAAAAMILPATGIVIARILSLSALASILITCGAMLHGFGYRLMFVGAILFGYAIIGWRHLLDTTDRSIVRAELRNLKLKIVAFGR
jgi:O-antigen/teichoic acid export membrane protein